MNIDDSIIDKLAQLSKLNFDNEKKEIIKNDLNKIIGFMEKLNAIDTEGIEPLIYVNEDVNILREDNVTFSISKEEALQNAPHHDEDYIKVPKFIKSRQ
jgi:aspartyl-tRNA(Asn)/glutamyl-tRNA(Gln) amidotransferase subunit C